MTVSREQAREVVAALHVAHDNISRKWEAACAPGCAACCTDRVLITSLEGELLAAELERLGRGDLLAQARAVTLAAPPARASMNALARMCLAHQEPPAEEPPAGPVGACPLLEDGRCAAYAARPLACRVMVSRQTCAQGGEAVGDHFWVALGAAMVQLVEAASLGGAVGYLGQVLAGGGAAPCEPLPGLLAEPDQQARLESALGLVFAKLVRDRPLGPWLDDIRRQGGTRA